MMQTLLDVRASPQGTFLLPGVWPCPSEGLVSMAVATTGGHRIVTLVICILSTSDNNRAANK